MSEAGDGAPPGSPPARPSAAWRAVGFVLAVLGIVLVAITPNPPETLRHWIQIVAGASLTAFLSTYAGWHEVARLLRHRPTWLLRWLQRRRVALGMAIVLTAALAFGVPPAWEFARGVSMSIVGCAPDTQLRMVADPETVTTARRLAGAYEQWTATGNHDCPTVDIYVYSGSTDEIRDRIRKGTGWSDESTALRDIGPQPDIWLTATSHELDGLPAPAADGSAISSATPIAFSPVVMAVPDAVAVREKNQRSRWADLYRRLTDGGLDVVRADPDSTQLGLLATALLYGLPDSRDGAASPQQLAPAEVEQRIAASLDRGDFPLTDTPGLLCRYRALGSQAAAIASEQQVVRFNLGDPLGGSCLSGTDRPGRLTALYPTDTRALDHQYVRLAWSDPPQEQAADRFGTWLLSDPGREAIVRTGLRPVGPFTVGPTLTTPGIDPGPLPTAEPIPAGLWDGITAAHDLAQRRGRVLFALDTSGSMATEAPEGRRSDVATAAVSAALADMGPRDEFGLWYFPDTPGTGHVEAVPLGPSEPARQAAALQSLGGVHPAGNTPLFRTMVDGAAAVGPADPGRVDAVVVLTDGEDTSSGLTADAVSTALAGSGVRLVVVTIGEIRCSDPGLSAITTATAGECRDADLSSLDTVLRTAVAGLWGGR